MSKATQSKASLLQPTPMAQEIVQSARYALALTPVSCSFCIVSQWKGYQILTVRSYSSQCILTKLWHNKAFSDFHNLNEAAHSRITFQHVQWEEVPDLTLQPAGSVQMIVSGCGSKKSLKMRESIPHAAAMLGIPVEDVRVVLIW